MKNITTSRLSIELCNSIKKVFYTHIYVYFVLLHFCNLLTCFHVCIYNLLTNELKIDKIYINAEWKKIKTIRKHQMKNRLNGNIVLFAEHTIAIVQWFFHVMVSNMNDLHISEHIFFPRTYNIWYIHFFRKKRLKFFL